VLKLTTSTLVVDIVRIVSPIPYQISSTIGTVNEPRPHAHPYIFSYRSHIVISDPILFTKRIPPTGFLNTCYYQLELDNPRRAILVNAMLLLFSVIIADLIWDEQRGFQEGSPSKTQSRMIQLRYRSPFSHTQHMSTVLCTFEVDPAPSLFQLMLLLLQRTGSVSSAPTIPAGKRSLFLSALDGSGRNPSRLDTRWRAEGDDDYRNGLALVVDLRDDEFAFCW
jgi:hypothetical protein